MNAIFFLFQVDSGDSNDHISESFMNYSALVFREDFPSVIIIFIQRKLLTLPISHYVFRFFYFTEYFQTYLLRKNETDFTAQALLLIVIWYLEMITFRYL